MLKGCHLVEEGNEQRDRDAEEEKERGQKALKGRRERGEIKM